MIKLNPARSRALFAAAALSGAMMFAAPASAAVTPCFETGNATPQCPSTDTNVLLTGASNVAIGSKVISNFNGSPVQTGYFVSSTDVLNADASGQAVVSSVDGLLNNLTYMTINGITFTTATFNLIGSATGTIFGTSANGTAFSNSFTISNGQNFSGLLATNGDVLNGFTISSTGGISDFRQLRLGGLAVSAVPEPATWALMLMGFGGMGVAMRRRRSAAALQQMA